MRQGELNIGLSYYQEREWITAINHYGQVIMDKSLLSQSQKTALLKQATQEKMILNKV
jgi:hypothetical protein